MAKKRLKKKAIREDKLVTVALQTSGYVREHFTQVITGLVVLLAAVAIIIFTANARRNTARAANRELAVGMQYMQSGNKSLAGTTFANLADRYSGHKPGEVAIYFLAECLLSQLRYQEALAAYERYIDKKGSSGEFYQAARIGTALSNEGLQKYAVAAEILEDVAGSMDQEDTRYIDVLERAARFYHAAENTRKAVELFERLSEVATGRVQDRAKTMLVILQ